MAEVLLYEEDGDVVWIIRDEAGHDTQLTRCPRSGNLTLPPDRASR
jgi:hypothetical protein